MKMTFCSPVYSAGVSLLELIFVTMIAAAILMGSMKIQRSLSFSHNSSELAKSVNLIQQGLNNYFYQFCGNGFSSPAYHSAPKVSELLLQNALSNEDLAAIHDPFAKNNADVDFTLAIVDVNEKQQQYFQFQVTARMDDYCQAKKNDLTVIAQMLHANTFDNDACTLTWTLTPRHTVENVDSNQWMLQSTGVLLLRNNNTVSTNKCYPQATS